MSNPKVLLIDDEEELVMTLVERLAFRNIDATAEMDGHSALERIQREKFDLVIADMKMPGLGGLEVAAILRERYPDVKILLITGHGLLDEEKDMNVDGVSDILIKPFSIDVLIAAINKALESEL
ncbi:regulatory protein LuxO [bacterium BMS3Bbin04]|nr:regulatory protein LuxO [bacterium BMS3Bbin04]